MANLIFLIEDFDRLESEYQALHDAADRLGAVTAQRDTAVNELITAIRSAGVESVVRGDRLYRLDLTDRDPWLAVEPAPLRLA
ncbi:MAG: hypothetical protein ACYC61_15875 [Isosphaeraceae bacterium]